uniref:Eukaryotic translation initiation factor 4C n=1 Tax=Cyprinus carpio carpio TaxID=630221 RepID=A0A8C0XW18_CYPCA
MPKNKGKGGKNRRRGKNENESEKRELVFKEDGQEYAQVIKMLGNGRLEAMCFDGVKRLCHIRGKLRKKVWINTSDIVLIGLRDYQDTKADVILKYNADEARSLKAYGELPEHAKINETDTFGPGDDDEIQFDDIGSDEEDIDDERLEALMRKSLERSLQLENRNKRWAWGPNSTAQGECNAHTSHWMKKKRDWEEGSEH